MSTIQVESVDFNSTRTPGAASATGARALRIPASLILGSILSAGIAGGSVFLRFVLRDAAATVGATGAGIVFAVFVRTRGYFFVLG